MARTGLLAPLVILVIGLALTATVLARTEPGSAPVRVQDPSYPLQTAQPGYPAPTTGATSAPQPAQTQATAATGAATQTVSTPTLAVTSVPTQATATLAAQVQPTSITPSVTPTLALSGTVPCTPGVELTITGIGPPRAPILLYFGRRIVGGGSVEPRGTFSLPLLVGVEEPGDHLVSVRVRGSDQVLTEFTCAVPSVTPTPLPGRRPFP
jgi:hypothetical protein